MSSLTQRFFSLFNDLENGASSPDAIASMLFSAPATPESNGLLSVIYHQGIGVKQDLEKSRKYAEDAYRGGNMIGYFMMGYLSDNDQETAFYYEQCAESGTEWAAPAHQWLGDYYMGYGGDPEKAVAHYEAIGEAEPQAAAALCDYYWHNPQLDADHSKVFHWTSTAARLNPHKFSYLLGCLYAEGKGCKADFQMAHDNFEDAITHGDKRGATALVILYRDRLKQPDLSGKERYICMRKLFFWSAVARDAKKRFK